MKKALEIAILLTLTPALLFSCKKAEEQKPPQPKAPAKAVERPLGAAAGAIDAAAQPDSTVDARYRNPFQSHLVLMKGVETGKKAKGPLECCELSSFKLIAVAAGTGSGEGFALVQAPDGKRYVIRRGDSIGAREGKITKILSKSLSVKEIIRSDDGKIKSAEEVELRMLEKSDKPDRKM